MDAAEMRQMSKTDLFAEEKKLRKELFELEFKNGTRQLMDTASITKVKRQIARLLTVKAEKSAAA